MTIRMNFVNTDFFDQYKFCPRCKGNLQKEEREYLTCKNCGFHLYINPVPAKRRTKKQKMKAAVRKAAPTSENTYSLANLDVETRTPQKHTPQVSKISLKDYSHVWTETKKTFLITAAVLVAQFVLVTLIRTNIINLPF